MPPRPPRNKIKGPAPTDKVKRLAELRIQSLLKNDGRTIGELGAEAGFAPKYAYKTASRALNDPGVAGYVESRVMGKHKASTDEVLHLLACILRGDVGDYDGADVRNEDGSLNLKELKKRNLSRAIRKHKTVTTFDQHGNKTVTTEIELEDKLAAAKLLIPVLQMVKPAPTVNVNFNVSPEDVAWARERAEAYRAQGWDDAQIVEALPEVAEILQLTSGAIQ